MKPTPQIHVAERVDRPDALSRRDLLKLGLAGAAGLAAGGFASPASAELTDYRALVCVFLLGGNDSFNMIVPRSAAEYAAYSRSRQNLAIANADLLPITPTVSDGAQYGFHPRMTAVARLFEAGRLGVVANVGPLVQPATKAQVLANAVPLPPQLFSHNDQQEQWQTLKGRSQVRTGWAGRIADELASQTTAQKLPVGVSFAGTLSFQIGTAATPYVLGTDGAPAYFLLTNPQAAFYAERRAMFQTLLDASTTQPIRRALADVHRRSLSTADAVNAALAAAPPLATTFPTGSLGDQLRAVARTIAARDALSVKRQVFLVTAGGYDTHDVQNQAQPTLLGDLSAALGAFDAALTELGVADRVVTFTQSDFGRTLTSNGDGTDHGWGGHQLVMGAAVRGRTIHGTMPNLEIGGADDVGGGRIVPTQSVDQYAATLARWFGLDEAAIDRIAPGLGAFPTRTLGFV
jgi:uncharacterized protein (DUF1501 family)